MNVIQKLPRKKAAEQGKSQPVVRTTITIPETIKKIGHQLARERRRSFSNYLATLIEADGQGDHL